MLRKGGMFYVVTTFEVEMHCAGSAANSEARLDAYPRCNCKYVAVPAQKHVTSEK